MPEGPGYSNEPPPKPATNVKVPKGIKKILEKIEKEKNGN